MYLCPLQSGAYCITTFRNSKTNISAENSTVVESLLKFCSIHYKVTQKKLFHLNLVRSQTISDLHKKTHNSSNVRSHLGESSMVVSDCSSHVGLKTTIN